MKKAATKKPQKKVTKKMKIPKINSRFLPVFFVFGFALIGLMVLRLSLAQSNSSANCGTRVQNYTYKVPFADSPWNIPACNIPLYGNSSEQASEFGKRLYEYGTAWNAQDSWWQARIPEQKGKFMTQFGLAGDSKDYGTPIYYANKNTPRQRIMICSDDTCLPSNLETHKCTGNYEDIKCYTPDAGIPWDPSWRPSGSTDDNYFDDASDREAVIIDTDTGYVYGMWRVNYAGNECLAKSIVYAIAGRSPESRLCVGGATILRNQDGTPANYYTYNAGTEQQRGMGIQNAAMIVTPEEVEAGEIRHALTMEAFNTMFGPACSQEELNNITLQSKCGYAVAPATMLEWYNANDILRAGTCSGIKNVLADFNTKQTFQSYMTQDKMIPEGMRFVLNMTDQQIDQWILSRPDLNPNHPSYNKSIPVDTTNKKARTAKIFATALKDYGWIVGDTTCYGSGFTVAGSANKEAKEKWANLGITDSSSQLLLEGLFTNSNILALDPPTNTCMNGTKTKFACKFTKSTYENLATSNDTPPVLESSPNPSAGGSDSNQDTIIEEIKDIDNTAEQIKPTTPIQAEEPASNSSSDSKNPTPVQQPTNTQPNPGQKPTSITLQRNPIRSVVKWDSRRWEFRQSAELIWNKSVATSNGASIASYTVSRNGENIYTGLDTRHYDTEISSGNTYTYQIFATDSFGNKSDTFTYKASYKCSFFGISCSFRSL